MKTKPATALDDVKRIAAASEAEALANRWAVSIAIVDDGGHLLWLQRLDGAAPISAQIAPGKAPHRRSAAASRVYEEMINQGRVSFLSARRAWKACSKAACPSWPRPVHRRGGRERREVDGRRADRACGHRRTRSCWVKPQAGVVAQL